MVSTTLLSTTQHDTHCVKITCYDFLLLRYRPGADTVAAAAQISTAAAEMGCPFGVCTVTSDQRPRDIRNFTAIRDTPLALGALLAVLAVGTLAHVLLTSVHRRRRELAVLKTLGLTRSQVLGLGPVREHGRSLRHARHRGPADPGGDPGDAAAGDHHLGVAGLECRQAPAGGSAAGAIAP